VEYLITLETVDESTSDTFVIEADSRPDAIDLAFWTRNIPTSWRLISITWDGDDEPGYPYSITYGLWARTRHIRERR